VRRFDGSRDEGRRWLALIVAIGGTAVGVGSERVGCLIAEGLSNKAIAARLFITERTVEAHITATFAKLGVAGDPNSHRRVLVVLAYLRSNATAPREHPW
jgi:DNA-binding CsgD family transcriptional regulator